MIAIPKSKPTVIRPERTGVLDLSEFTYVNAGDLSYRLGLLTPMEIMQISTVERMTSDGSAGFQRELSTKHAQEYLDAELAKIRDGRIHVLRSVVLAHPRRHATSVLPDEYLSVIDGQHFVWVVERIYQLSRELAESDELRPKLIEYLYDVLVPVVIGDGWTEEQKRRAFVELNVSLKLSGNLLRTLSDSVGMADPIERLGYQVVKQLAYDPVSPFFGRIYFGQRGDRERKLSADTLLKVVVAYFIPEEDGCFERVVEFYRPIFKAFGGHAKLLTNHVLFGMLQCRDLLGRPGMPERLAELLPDKLDTFKGMTGSGSGARLVAQKIREVLSK